MHGIYVKKQIKVLELKNNAYEIKNSMNGVNRRVKIIEGKESMILKIEKKKLFFLKNREKDCSKIKES